MYYRNLANYALKPLNAFRSSRILFRKRRVIICARFPNKGRVPVGECTAS